MLVKLSSIILFLLIGCASQEKYYKHQLYRQRLVIRIDHPGHLTNQTCVEMDGEDCKKWDITTYDMNDEEFRRKANDFRIVCRLGGKRWRICLKKAGFCRRICLKKGWGGKCKKHEEKFIPATDHQYLYDAGTVCKTYLRGGANEPK